MLKIFCAVSAAAIAVAPAVDAGEMCPRSAAKGSVFESPILLNIDRPDGFVEAEKKLIVTETLQVVSTSGFVLMADMVFDGEQAGTVAAGTLLEYTGVAQSEICTLNGAKRGDFQLCYYDQDTDGVFETGKITKTGFWSGKSVEFELNEQPALKPAKDVASTASSIADLPNMTAVIGTAVQITKLKGKYIELGLANGSSFKTRMSDKVRERCGDICLSYYRPSEKIRVDLKDLHPVELGSVTVRFKLDGEGKLFVAATGRLEPVDIEISCDRKVISFEGVQMSKW